MKSFIFSFLLFSLFGTVISASQESCPLCESTFKSSFQALEHIQQSCKEINFLRNIPSEQQYIQDRNKKAFNFLIEVQHYLYSSNSRQSFETNEHIIKPILYHILQQPIYHPKTKELTQLFLDQIAPQDLSSFVD